jgi:hypothetical protein
MLLTAAIVQTVSLLTSAVFRAIKEICFDLRSVQHQIVHIAGHSCK